MGRNTKTQVLLVKSQSKHVIGHRTRDGPCYEAAEILAELYSSVW